MAAEAGLIDSHCHLTFPEFEGKFDQVLSEMRDSNVIGAVSVSVVPEDFALVKAMSEGFPRIWATIGVHPDSPSDMVIQPERLVREADHPKVLAIGETGLDYYRLTGDLEWQRQRFRTHIRAAIEIGKPLVVHTRSAAEDTIRVLREERAERVGGIMHCFTESLGVAQAAMDLGFLISFSGIVSFKGAGDLRAVACSLPLDMILVETDSPYLAPVPFRGKTNRPAFVREVASALAAARGIPLDELAVATTGNFRRLFPDTL